MAGIYIHYPYCKKACHYCNFHFSTVKGTSNALFESLLIELTLQKEFLQNEKVNTIYLGGGTPSLLSSIQLTKLFDTIVDNYSLSDDLECTLEANPDDLSSTYLNDIKSTFINRLSIGIQTFFDNGLQWMNRSHTSEEAASCIQTAQDVGIDNITVDLIYGYPLLSDEEWMFNLDKIIEFGLSHFSAYSLTVEEKTALHQFIQSGKQKQVDDKKAAQQFNLLMDFITKHQWQHYEISNFAKSMNDIGVHNTNYWTGVKYLGIGPSAHSYDGDNRYWNVSNNPKYLQSIKKGIVPSRKEELTKSNKINEYIMTSLRTSFGCSISRIASEFKTELPHGWNRKIDSYVSKDWIRLENDTLILTQKGKLFADHISSELFIPEE